MKVKEVIEMLERADKDELFVSGVRNLYIERAEDLLESFKAGLEEELEEGLENKYEWAYLDTLEFFIEEHIEEQSFGASRIENIEDYKVEFSVGVLLAIKNRFNRWGETRWLTQNSTDYKKVMMILNL